MSFFKRVDQQHQARMPPSPKDAKGPFRVLVTGYGTFHDVSDNPSWLAAAPLHNVVIHTESNSIHVTALGPLKVSYKSVLDIVPSLYARPPRLPPLGNQEGSTPGQAASSPPPEGYDLILHLGVAGPGHLSIEQVGHKWGYDLVDVDGKLPSILSDAGAQRRPPSAAQQAEAARGDPSGEDQQPFTSETYLQRGFAENYERFPDSMHTEVDVNSLIEHLKQQGETRVHASTDAGYFLCDFITYCGLAESQRTLFYPETEGQNMPRSKSLFMHVPPRDTPHTIEEMTEAVRQILAWVCTGEKALPN